MATDSTKSVTLSPADDAAVPIIENEIPAYRAISPLAVVSLILGLLTIFSFADPIFLAAGVLAMVTGWRADAKIKRLPDVLTGRKLAQAGFGLGLAFGLAALTTDLVQGAVRQKQATTFANAFLDSLRNGSVSRCFWLRLQPQLRANSKPEDVLSSMEQHAQGQESMYVAMQVAPIKAMKDRLAHPNQTIKIAEIEKHGVDGLSPYVLARLRLNGPAVAGHEPEEHALLIIKGVKEKGRVVWWIDDIKYPYEPNTGKLKEKPIDDGHGHSHGHGH